VGAGSYGSVFQAVDPVQNRVVAIKWVKRVFVDLVDCKRILREISILSKLRHPNVVQIYDLTAPGSDTGYFDELNIVMELCDSDLKKLCKVNVTLEPVHINTVLYNFLLGLRYIHSAGILHRDLKPANVLVNQDCSVKICDFGLARAAFGEDTAEHEETPASEEERPGAAPRRPRSLTGHVVTRWYRAPELILLNVRYTEAIDVWSVGCILAELLQTLKGGPPASERNALFPGSSCFPLSPVHRRRGGGLNSRGDEDQLGLIFDLLGIPPECDLDHLEREDAKKYVKTFKQTPGEGLKSFLPHVEGPHLDLLANMLRFRPAQRFTVASCLDHEVFRGIRDHRKEITAPNLIKLDFDKEGGELDEISLRRLFSRELQAYLPAADGDADAGCSALAKTWKKLANKTLELGEQKVTEHQKQRGGA
jgi:mitogen-activated protein kinase 1/3